MGESTNIPHVTPYHTDPRDSEMHRDRTPEEIRRDIEETRARLGETAAQLQDRLSPAHLREQALHSVREVRDHALHSAREQTIGRAQDMVRGATHATRNWFSNVIHMIVENPVPAALTGIGLGWLLAENAARSHEHDVYIRTYDQPSYGTTGYGSTGYSAPGYSAPGYESTTYGTTGYGTPPPYGTTGYGTTGYGTAAYARTGYDRTGYDRAGYDRTVYGRTETTGSGVQGSVSGQEYAGATSTDQSGGVGERVRDAVSEGRERVGEVGERVRDAVSEARERVGEVGERLAERAREYGYQSREQLEHLSHEARRSVRRASTIFARTLEENPMVIGTATLGLGAMIGLSLPHTRSEDELMGPHRDQLVTMAQEGAVQALDKGQEVVKETLRAAESKVHQVVDEAVKPRVQASIDSSGDHVRVNVRQSTSSAQDVAHNALDRAESLVERTVDQVGDAAKRQAQNAGESLKDSGKPRV